MRKGNRFWEGGTVVGTAHTARGLGMVGKGVFSMVDAVEIRLDQLKRMPELQVLEKAGVPVILTPRHFAEGGGREWGERERLGALAPLLSAAAAVDIELLLLEEGRELQREVFGAGVPLILSFHDFVATPSFARLQELYGKACAEGAAVFKVATALQDAGDIGALLSLLEESRGKEVAVAVMGMGTLGRASRIYLAAAGSVLNYGWLHRPQVPGQYPAKLLKKRLMELVAN